MDQLARLLADTQRPEEAPRKQAEIDLKHAQLTAEFPEYLAAIAAASTYPTEIRQSALSVLRNFIQHNWSEDDDDDDAPRIPIPEETKQKLRIMLLELATRNEEDRRVKAAVSYVVGKIAIVDYPDRWPDLLDNVLSVIRTGTDLQLHGALRVLGDLVDDSLSENQFFTAARQIVEVLYQVSLDTNRKPALRALAVLVFRSSFDLMDIVKEEHRNEVTSFAQEALSGWLPFFHDVLTAQLPPQGPGTPSERSEESSGMIALKLQVVKTLIKIKGVFASLLLPQSPQFFEETWKELSNLRAAYSEQYINNDSQGRLEDADGLPYTLDFLVLEELDFLNHCLRASPVQKQLDTQLKASPKTYETPWMLELMDLLVSYSRISREEEELWDIDVSLYLAEETSVTANYTARTACGDLLIKLGEWIGEIPLEGLYAHTQTLFNNNVHDWKSQEAALYLFNMLVNDLMDCGKEVRDEICKAYMGLVEFAVTRIDQPLLEARGYLVAGTLAQCFPDAVQQVLDRTILAVNQSASELVQVACVKALEGFIKSSHVPRERQVPIIQAVDGFISAKDFSDLADADDLLVTLAETLRAAIGMNRAIVLDQGIKSLDLLFSIAKYGAQNFQITMLVNESFEEIVQSLSDPHSYEGLYRTIQPTLNGFFTVADMTKEGPLLTLATELLAVLVQYGPEPLPQDFVNSFAPKLKRLLVESNEGEVLRPAAESLKYMLMHDHQQVFEWVDGGENGLIICLQIIARLLGPSIEDNSASEVGGLAAELVEKAGYQRLGDHMKDLLQAVAVRLSSAESAPFIQSLILVFARLCLHAAPDVVEFLSQINVAGNNGPENGLQVVLSKWLENSINFAGYDEIRQNVIALSKLYALEDARIAQTQVKGDLIVPTSDRIVTRSQAKQNPDQYTIISAQLKILKVLIEELLSAQGKLGSAAATAAAVAADLNAEDDDGDEGWEDDPDTIDLSLGATKADLMSYIDASSTRQRDDETQAYLTEFFLRAARDNIAGFKGWYDQLTEEEKAKLQELAAH